MTNSTMTGGTVRELGFEETEYVGGGSIPGFKMSSLSPAGAVIETCIPQDNGHWVCHGPNYI